MTAVVIKFPRGRARSKSFRQQGELDYGAFRIFDRWVSNRDYCGAFWRRLARRLRPPCMSVACLLDAGHEGAHVLPWDVAEARARKAAR